MRIGAITVRNFKSLLDVRLELAKFTCLIGLNGAGKSTVLQSTDFLAAMVRGGVKDWLDKRRWKSSDLRCRLAAKRTSEFVVEVVSRNGKPVGTWMAHFSSSTGRCTSESLELPDGTLTVTGENLQITREATSYSTSIGFNYEGSVLSALKDKLLTPKMIEFRDMILGVESLELLTPERLRERTRTATGTLGHGGRNLSAYVAELPDEKLKRLLAQLRRVYPELRSVASRSLRSGWKQLMAIETFGSTTLRTESRHLNDGMLRLMAILAELMSERRVVLFDEIENGLNPELIEFVMERLVRAAQQVLVTTHSPMILNYLDDEVARKGVLYLYRTAKGATQAIPFFSIPSMAEKLQFMGPGEVFVDTNLLHLADEIAALESKGDSGVPASQR
jgi:predicted ATPase